MIKFKFLRQRNLIGVILIGFNWFLILPEYSDVQYEILKILSEKDDLKKENELLRQYRQSYIDIVMENNILRQKLQILEISRRDRTTKQNLARMRPRSDPDGQEDSKINSCFSIKWLRLFNQGAYHWGYHVYVQFQYVIKDES